MPLSIKFLKTEFCRFEENFKNLKIRVKVEGVFDAFADNIFTAKIITALGMEYIIDDWEETILDTTTSLVKNYDLNSVSFIDGKLPLNIGTHTLQIQINDTIETGQFKVVPVTVTSIKNQYMLGIELESKAELVIQQPLRKITGVNFLQISKETPVGAKELVWDFDNQTLAWDNGEPVLITDEYLEYHLTNYMSVPGITDGDYIKIEIDYDSLPAQDETENVLVDVKKYTNEDFQYWINNGYRVVAETIIMTDLEPTLYSSDKTLGYKYLPPVTNIPKNYSETMNFSFEFSVNMLQDIIQLWTRFLNADRVNIDLGRIEHSLDGQVVVRGFPHNIGLTGNTATIGLAGLWDRTIYAKSHYGSRNKTKNFWNATLIAGIADDSLRELALDIVAKIAAIDLLIQAGLGRGAGISSRSFSVGGISSSFNTTESAENSLYSGIITDLQRRLGSGKATKEEQRAGLIAALKSKILGGSMAFKY